MRCDFFDRQLCLSCQWLGMPYREQIEEKERQLQALLEPFHPEALLESVKSPQEGFRNKAKMQVLGYAHAPILGIINHAGAEISLCECPLYPPVMQKVLKRIESWIKEAGIMPYRIDKKRGELKYILLSHAPSSGEMMLRFVLKSRKSVDLIRGYLPLLQEPFPFIKVISVNIQPVHMAILEGEEELFLTQQQEIKEVLNGVPLYMRPKSFFQTNSAVAEKLYLAAGSWTEELGIQTLWDLFCGVGGFGLHCATPKSTLTGIEIQAEAIACAKRSAAELGLQGVEFKALDSALLEVGLEQKPQLILVNPPRRGLGDALCEKLSEVEPSYIVYSSCNAKSLAADLKRLPGYTLEKVQLFDMFPHTPHYEVLTLLARRS